MTNTDKKSTRNKFDFRVSEIEVSMIKVLKDKHFINVSGFLRKSIRDLYEKKEEAR